MLRVGEPATVAELAGLASDAMTCTGVEMAGRLGVSTVTVSRALRGETSQLATLLRILEELGYTVARDAAGKPVPHYLITPPAAGP
jgi:transcriptional regulator with XRE-family HTH domain